MYSAHTASWGLLLTRVVSPLAASSSRGIGGDELVLLLALSVAASFKLVYQ
jgi:hypothetical protein